MGGVAPIKLGEYLLCGLPAVATAGVGDTADMTPDVAFLLDGDPSRAEAAAVDWFVGTVLPDREGFRARCRAFGAARFSLDACVEGYARALRAIVPAQGGRR
jgi:glycosyltransferase involved in cell wall biosynthesis